jgi:RNA polymerase sigma-70 factor (ECF subfamily)
LEFSFAAGQFDDVASPAAERVEVIDEQQFRLLYERTARPLWAYLARVSGDVTDADDLLQEVYHRYLRAAPPEMDETGIRNYLFRIATNLLRDRLRTKIRRPETALPEQEPASGDYPGDRVTARTDLARAFEQMTERERKILWLAYAEGFSHREIGAAMGMKEQSVRPLLHRAKMKMSALLGRQGASHGQ